MSAAPGEDRPWTRRWVERYAAGPLDAPGDPDGLAHVDAAGGPPAYRRFVDRIQRRALDRFYDALPLHGSRALDLGCGPGRWARRLATRGARVTGLDVSPAVIAHNRRQARLAGVRFRVGEIERLPFAARAFDLVQSVTVLQHLPPRRQETAVAEMARVTARHGTILLCEGVWRPHPADLGVSWPRAPGSWIGLLAARGWRCVRAERCLFLPMQGVLTAVRRGWRRHAGPRRGARPAEGGARTIVAGWLLATLPLAALAEPLVAGVLAGRRWIRQRAFGALQVFAFRCRPR